MTKEENRARIKNEALNKIRKIYNPEIKNNIYSDYQEDGSYSEQRDYMVREIIENMEKEIREKTFNSTKK